MLEVPAQRILEVWELGKRATPEGRVRALLNLARPDLSGDAVCSLALGERNQGLIALRRSMFGSELQAYIECTGCGKPLDLAFSVEQLGFADTPDLSDQFQIACENLYATVRLPNSHDLAALSDATSVEEGRLRLLSRCITALHRDGKKIAPSDLDARECDALEAMISDLDPRMEILFDLHCPECSHQWQAPLEIGTFLWSEFDGYAQRLLENIHLLARMYGWSEADILEMSEVRRNYYVERLLQ